jgi:hypothetical protein
MFRSTWLLDCGVQNGYIVTVTVVEGFFPDTSSSMVVAAIIILKLQSRDHMERFEGLGLREPVLAFVNRHVPLLKTMHTP